MIINLPESGDLRQYAGNIDHQQATNSCVANRDTSAMELLLHRAGIKVELSRLFHYWNLRENGNMQGVDGGGKANLSYLALQQYGVPLESDWPFDVTKVNVKPTPEAYEAAKQYRITGCVTIEGGCGEPQLIEGMKVWLAKGCPILIAVNCHPDFGALRGATLEDTAAYISKNFMTRTNREYSHALLIVGYTKDGWIVENSYGSSWGCGGYFLAPSEWLWAFNDGSFQVITGIEGVQLTDLWVPEYDKPTKPEIDKKGRKHRMKCTIRRWMARLAGKKPKCWC